MYPVMLDVRAQRCLVVGGGHVALRKVDGLLAEGAELTVVTLEAVATLAEHAEAGRVRLERRAYRSGEARGYALVFAATDDREVNRRVFEDARAAGIWVNVADDPELCSFHLPARVRRGALQITVASAGESPFAVRRLRQLLERRFDPQWSEWARAAARFRNAVRELGLVAREEEARFDAFFDGTVDAERLTVRIPTAGEVASYLAAGEPLPGAGEPTRRVGLVSLVGGGPGDPGLVTVRALRRLLAADAVVFDRLAETALPCELPEHVELHDVGKRAGHHPVPQDEINALLVRLAREGKRVVRLKGGDPFVFGRGAEEAMELVRAGIPFEVVPAVTAGVAVPACAGIPVTHRRESVRCTFVTAHESVKATGSQVRWELLAADPHATILGYMGVSGLDRVVAELLAAGMDPGTPAALIERGTTSGQRIARAPLSEFLAAVAAAELRPPALFVIGPTVRHAETLDWFGTRPLSGERLVIAAPASALGEELELRGAEVVAVPLPLTPAARIVLGALPLSGCIARTTDELDAFERECGEPGWIGADDVCAWCLGPELATRAQDRGWGRVVEIDESLDPCAAAEEISRAITRRAAP